MRPFVVVVLVLFAVVAGCDSGELYRLSAEERDAYETAIHDALVALETEIGEARADDVASCRVLGLGEDDCGGPTYFRV